MVGDHAESDGFFHLAGELRFIALHGFGIDVGVGLTTECFQLAEDGLKDIGRVIGRLLREVGKALGVLNQ